MIPIQTFWQNWTLWNSFSEILEQGKVGWGIEKRKISLRNRYRFPRKSITAFALHGVDKYIGITVPPLSFQGLLSLSIKSEIWLAIPDLIFRMSFQLVYRKARPLIQVQLRQWGLKHSRQILPQSLLRMLCKIPRELELPLLQRSSLLVNCPFPPRSQLRSHTVSLKPLQALQHISIAMNSIFPVRCCPPVSLPSTVAISQSMKIPALPGVTGSVTMSLFCEMSRCRIFSFTL